MKMAQKKKRGRPKFKGCNEDCFHCPYPDCKKPVKQMQRDNSIVEAIRAEKSQARMFTLELGGYGGVRPNLSRKYYRG